MTNDLTPILIGAGQTTQKEADLDKISSPLDLMEAATWQAVYDAGIKRDQLGKLDVLVIVKSFREATRNSPEALASRLGAGQATQWLTPNGGNAPQYLVNRFAEAIANGELKFALFTGAEAMDSARRILKSGKKLAWEVPSSTDPILLFPDREMTNDHEKLHSMRPAAHVYPLFENALRAHYEHTIEQHQKVMGELFARFTEVAQGSPHAWYPVRRTPEEIATASPKNRYVGWPYTKYMNAMNQINQSAALLLTSVGFARELGVNESRWIYLHGCADTTEIWHVSERVNYYSSPAIRVMGEQALSMAGLSIDEIAFIDLYSCFPSAVEIARDELGIALDDPRPLTITGGLPFHGGAGNNYVMNSIAAMVEKLRAHPGKFGLVTANGGYLSKHAAGIYSTTPTAGPWRREDPATYQTLIDEAPRPTLEEDPEGRGTVETYTVTFARDGSPERGIVIGRLGDGADPDAPRFLANTPVDLGLLESMTREDLIGQTGTVGKYDRINLFRPGE